MVEPTAPNEKPHGASPTLQITIALACALVVAQTSDWGTAAHVFLAVLAVFTSANRAALPNRRCARCGHLQ